MNNVQERLAAGALAAPAFPGADAGVMGSPAVAGNALAARLGGDGISTFRPPAASSDIAFGGGLGSMLTQLLAMLRELLSGLSSRPQQPQQFFQKATGSSTGDPHLAFEGTTGSGLHRQSRFDSMTGHRRLLQSNSFAGGFDISTAVTAPGANGVTYNESATVATNFNNTLVSLDKNGNATVTNHGQSQNLAANQSLDLGSGETITRNADGSLLIRETNGNGGYITTTLSQNGSGVDVNVSAADVDLRGDLVRGFGG